MLTLLGIAEHTLQTAIESAKQSASGTLTQSPEALTIKPENLTLMIVAGVFAGGFIATTLVICGISLWRCRPGAYEPTNESLLNQLEMHIHGHTHHNNNQQMAGQTHLNANYNPERLDIRAVTS
jgi:hypothetical protein